MKYFKLHLKDCFRRLYRLISNKHKTVKTISLIIPVYNALPETKDLFASIEQSNLSENVEIIIMNDKSDSETTEFLKQLSARFKKYRLINNLENLQFVKNCNKGMNLSKGDVIVLLNSDTLIPKRWEERILECFNSCPSIGVASPIASASGLWNVPIINGMNFEEMDSHIEKISDKKYPVVVSPEGFCFAIRRECYETILTSDGDQGFDEVFCPCYCEETDFSIRVLKQGWKTVIIDNLYVYHKRQASMGSELRKQQIDKNAKILFDRHDDIVSIRNTEYKTQETIDKIVEKIYK